MGQNKRQQRARGWVRDKVTALMATHIAEVCEDIEHQKVIEEGIVLIESE